MKRRNFFAGLLGLLGLGTVGKALGAMPTTESETSHLPQPLDEMMGFEQAIKCMKAGHGVFNTFYQAWFRIRKNVYVEPFVPKDEPEFLGFDEALRRMKRGESYSPFNSIGKFDGSDSARLEIGVGNYYIPIDVTETMAVGKEWTIIRKRGSPKSLAPYKGIVEQRRTIPRIDMSKYLAEPKWWPMD